jgi:hypothetical protein
MQIWCDNHRVPGLPVGHVRQVHHARRVRPGSCAPLVAALVALAACGCGASADQPPKPAEPAIGWHQLGQWSGRGNRQTESFTSDTGALRLRWETTPQPGDASAAAGTFHVTAHSAISGRPLQEVVDETGIGSGVGYVQQDPHVFYVVVDSSHVNWTFTVEEAVAYR